MSARTARGREFLWAILGLGLVVDAIAGSLRPVVVDQPPPDRIRCYVMLEQYYRSYAPDEPEDSNSSRDYPPPKQNYPECK